MANLNKVFLIGRLTREPELRKTAGGTAVADFRIAINRSYTTTGGDKREETVFVDVNVWGRGGEVCAAHLRKGSEVFIEGRLRLDTWETRDGQKRSKLKVVGESFQFLDSNSQSLPIDDQLDSDED